MGLKFDHLLSICVPKETVVGYYLTSLCEGLFPRPVVSGVLSPSSSTILDWKLRELYHQVKGTLGNANNPIGPKQNFQYLQGPDILKTFYKVLMTFDRVIQMNL